MGKLPFLESAAQLDIAGGCFEQLSSLYTARELTGELASRLEGYSFDPGELDEIEGRLDELYRLSTNMAQRWRMLLPAAKRRRMESMEHSTERLEELEQQKQKLYREAKTGGRTDADPRSGVRPIEQSRSRRNWTF